MNPATNRMTKAEPIATAVNNFPLLPPNHPYPIAIDREYTTVGEVSASGYFIPERGNLIFPHNIWTDTRDLYNQVHAINNAREHLGWPPKEFDRPQ